MGCGHPRVAEQAGRGIAGIGISLPEPDKKRLSDLSPGRQSGSLRPNGTERRAYRFRQQYESPAPRLWCGALSAARTPGTARPAGIHAAMSRTVIFHSLPSPGAPKKIFKKPCACRGIVTGRRLRLSINHVIISNRQVKAGQGHCPAQSRLFF